MLGHLYFSLLQGEGGGGGKCNNWNRYVPVGLGSLALSDGMAAWRHVMKERDCRKRGAV